MRKIFDAHTHIEKSFNEYDLVGVKHKNVIFNTIKSYVKNKELVSCDDTISLILDVEKFSFVFKEIENGKINGIKIHSREQKLNNSEYDKIFIFLSKIPDNIPVIYDAFYFGDNIEFQPSLSKLISLAKGFPEKNFIVAHSGGHKILEYFFHLRQLKNIYFELSFSLQYLFDSSCFLDLKKLIKYTPANKLIFGTDYYWASPSFQWEVLENIFFDLKLSVSDQNLIVYDNAKRLFLNSKIH